MVHAACPDQCLECVHYGPTDHTMLRGACENGRVAARAVRYDDQCHDPDGWAQSENAAGQARQRVLSGETLEPGEMQWWEP